MNIPTNYAWLAGETGPKMIVEAVKLYGVTETPGAANNAEILAWAAEAGVGNYIADSVPWCGLFMAVIAFRAGKPFPKNPLWALNWQKFGKPSGVAELGDVLVFVRPGGGHVGLYVGEDVETYHVFGGNTSDRVGIARILKTRCVAIRRPAYTNQPANVRKIMLAANGVISTNEA